MNEENGDKRAGGFLSRTPFAIIGAFGLVSLSSGIIDLERHIADWVQVWKSVTHPVWEFLFGWFFEWTGLRFPWWLKDYLTAGFIFSTSWLRFAATIDPGYTKFRAGMFGIRLFVTEKKWLYVLWYAVVIFFTWPFEVPNIIRHGLQIARVPIKAAYPVFFETVIWALIFIAISFALIFSGVSEAG